MKNFVLAGAVLVLVAGCGSAAASTPSPTPSQGSPIGFDVTATEMDHTVAMHVGQKLELVLHGGNAFSWQQVHSSNTAVLTPIVNPAATAIRGVTLAAFQAKTAGSAEVTAVGSPVCPSGQACPMYAALYSLKVSVTP